MTGTWQALARLEGWFMCLFYPGMQSVLPYMVFERLPIMQDRVTSKLKHFPGLLLSFVQIPLDKPLL